MGGVIDVPVRSDVVNVLARMTCGHATCHNVAQRPISLGDTLECPYCGQDAVVYDVYPYQETLFSKALGGNHHLVVAWDIVDGYGYRIVMRGRYNEPFVVEEEWCFAFPEDALEAGRRKWDELHAPLETLVAALPHEGTTEAHHDPDDRFPHPDEPGVHIRALAESA